MADFAQERTEEATPRRKQQARRKGTVTRSVDLNGALVLLALCLVLPTAFSALAAGFLTSTKMGLANLPTEARLDTLGTFIGVVVRPCILGIVLIAGTAMVVGVAANFAQVGFVLSTESITPSFAKLNPFNGLKRLFSMSATFDGLKAGAKACLFMYLGYTAIVGSWPEISRLGYMSPLQGIGVVGDLMRTIALRIAFVWLVLAAADYLFQRKQVTKQLRMTKEEVKQEMKEMETSPELKAAQHARRRKLAKGRMLDAVKDADVIVTNPTHYAVAIKYEPEKSHAPIVVAKGADFLAAKIRDLAKEHRIPLVPNPPLARALYRKCETGDFVPRELFQAVAEVLAFVYRTLRQVRGA